MVVLLYKKASDIETANAIQALLQKQHQVCRLELMTDLELTPTMVAGYALKRRTNNAFLCLICLSDGKAVAIRRPAEQFRKKPRPDQGYGDPCDLTFGQTTDDLIRWLVQKLAA